MSTLDESYSYEELREPELPESNSATSKYNVSNYVHPSDLFDNQAKYGGCWVMINVNVRESPTFNNAYAGNTVQLDPTERKNFSNTAKRQESGSNTFGSAVAGAGLAGAGAGVLKVGAAGLGSLITGSKAKALGEIAQAAGIGAATGAAAAFPMLSGNNSFQYSSTKRLKDAIMLPMPNSLVTGYTADWSEDEQKKFDLMMRLGAGAIDLASGKGMDTNSFIDGTESVALGISQAFGSRGVSAATGLAANPKKELVFDNMGFRQFVLEYKLFPKTAQEHANVMNIIHLLKFHMHPEFKSPGRFTYIMPSEFDITFYVNNRENYYLNKIATSVLTNLTVNYTPDGVWAAQELGSPNTISIAMTFKELTVHTKETIQLGF